MKKLRLVFAAFRRPSSSVPPTPSGRGSLWLVAAAFLAAAGCAPPESEPAAVETETPLAADELEGELVTYVADFADGHAERWHALRTTESGELRLGLDEPAALPRGGRVRVAGHMEGDRFRVTRVAPALKRTARGPGGDLASTSGALTSDEPEVFAAPAQDSYALVLVDTGGGVDKTMAQAQAAMASDTATDKTFAAYYKESSYGKYNITGTVLGPYSYSMTSCDYSGMAKAIEAKITGTYNHLIYYFKMSNLCDFAGLGEEGSAVKPAKRTWMNGSLSCVVLMQEPGHNLGLMHANTMKCGGNSFSTTPGSSCTITEYGSTMTTMGGGCKQLNAYERWYMQWLTGCNGVRVPGNATVNLLPLENACPGGVQVLQVPFPQPLTVSDPQSQGTAVSLKNYYLELRTAGGNFDAYGTASRPGAVTFTQPTVFVYTSDDVRVPTGAATTRNNQNSVWTELLNMTPSNSSFTGLTSVGQSFVDPAGGPTITLQAISATGATIAITNPKGSGSPTCIDGTALSGAGPTTCGAGEGGTGGTGGAGTGGTSGTGGVGGMATGGRATGGVPTGGAGGSKNGTGGGSSTGGAHTGGNVTAGGAAGHATTGGAPATGGRAGGTDAGINDNSTPPNGQLPGPSEIVGGCDCDTAPSAGSSSTGLALAAAVLLCLKRRRRETETCRARVRRPRGSRRIPSC